jgi:hypothetical protein
MFSRGKAALPLFSLGFPLTKLKYEGTEFPWQESSTQHSQKMLCVYVIQLVDVHVSALYTSSVQLRTCLDIWWPPYLYSFILMNLLSPSACGTTQWHQCTRHVQRVMGPEFALLWPHFHTVFNVRFLLIETGVSMAFGKASSFHFEKSWKRFEGSIPYACLPRI